MASASINCSKTCDDLDVQVHLIIHFPWSTDLRAIHTVMMAVCIILAISATYLNACTVLTIWKTNVLREKLSNFTILLLSFIDLLHGTLVMPSYAYLMLTEIKGSPSCITSYVIKNLACLLFLFSITSFVMMNYERYMGICHPLRHRTRMTKRKVFKYTIGFCSLQTLVFGTRFVYIRVFRFLHGLACLTFLGHTVLCLRKDCSYRTD